MATEQRSRAGGRAADLIDALCAGVGRAVAWFALLMVLGMCAVVFLRQFAGVGWIWMQESIVWLHATLFMLGAAWTLQRDEHVRVDVLYRRMTAGRRAVVRVLGTLLFLLPVCLFLLVASLDYVQDAWRFREQSREAGGLPYPFLPILKTMIPVSMGLLVLQGLAGLLRDVSDLRGGRAPGG